MSQALVLPHSAEALSPGERRRGLAFLRVAVAAVGFTMALQLGLNANFLADVIGVSGLEMGAIEAARETCGIVAFALLALLAGLAEPVIGAIVLCVLAVGLSGYAFAPDFAWVVGLSLIWSQGLHIWMPLPQSMAMALARKSELGHRLGQLQSAGAAGFGAGIAAAIVLNRAGVAIRPMYLLAGAAAVAAAAACLGIPRRVKVPGPRLVFRRRYGLFYLLSFLEGWRKQIFICFAAFLLVKVHHASLETILILSGVTHAIVYLVSSRVGRLIDRIGERRTLVMYYSCLAAFFAGYALIQDRRVLYGIYVLDNAFFVFAMALTTYVGRIAPPEERTATLSMGVAMNHVAAVVVPLVGGVVWVTLGAAWTFGIGAAAAALSLPVALRLPHKSGTYSSV